MNKNTALKLKDTLANMETYIKQLEAMPDQKPSKHLDLFRQQMQMAYRQKNHTAFELLVEYEKQVFMARLRKFDSRCWNDRMIHITQIGLAQSSEAETL